MLIVAYFAIALLLLSAGFAKLSAASVNWFCSLRIAKKIVFADKTLNLALMASYPVVLVWGLGSPMNLGSQTPLPRAFPLVLIAMGAFGLMLLIRSTIGYWLYKPPACELNVDSNLLDIRRLTESPWQTSLIQKGKRMHRLVRLPGNEQLTLEVNSKTYAFENLPPHWESLSIVQLSDFHFIGGVARRYFEIVCEQAAALKPDIFVFTGDLVDNQKLVEWLPETLGRLDAPLGQYFILGNHDWYLEPDQTRAAFTQLGWADLSSRFVVVPPRERASGAPLVLCGDETPWMGTHADLTNAPPESFRILLSHTPDNIGWARQNRIDLMIAGHTHGGQVRLPILGPVFCPSRFGCRFASGVYWLDPTLMYVSRGVSGKEPIRYNCPPEITKFILKRSF